MVGKDLQNPLCIVDTLNPASLIGGNQRLIGSAQGCLQMTLPLEEHCIHRQQLTQQKLGSGLQQPTGCVLNLLDRQAQELLPFAGGAIEEIITPESIEAVVNFL